MVSGSTYHCGGKSSGHGYGSGGKEVCKNRLP